MISNSSIDLRAVYATIKKLKNIKHFDGIDIQFVLDAWPYRTTIPGNH